MHGPKVEYECISGFDGEADDVEFVGMFFECGTPVGVRANVFCDTAPQRVLDLVGLFAFERRIFGSIGDTRGMGPSDELERAGGVATRSVTIQGGQVVEDSRVS